MHRSENRAGSLATDTQSRSVSRYVGTGYLLKGLPFAAFLRRWTLAPVWREGGRKELIAGLVYHQFESADMAAI
jgi:hypothetical protein